MIPVLANVTALEFVSGGFAAAATETSIITPEVLTAEIGKTSETQTDKNSFGAAIASGAVTATSGSVILPFLTAILSGAAVVTGVAGVAITSGSVMSSGVGDGSFKSTILYRAYKIIKSYIDGEGRPITEKEFCEALEYKGLIDTLRQVLKKHAQQHNITEHELYLNMLDKIRGNPAYTNINDEYKINLATRLTKGLL